MVKNLLSFGLLLFGCITAAQSQSIVTYTSPTGQTLYFETTGEYTSSGNELVVFTGYSQPLGYENVTHSLVIPSTFTHWGEGYNVKYIGEGAFIDWYNNTPAYLTTLTIPYTVEHISDSAFRQYGCPMLTTLNYNPIRATITRDGSTNYRSPFGYLSNLSTLNLGNRVEYIGNNMFRGLRNITSLNIPNSVRHIGCWAFRTCYSLTTITIPDSVTYIGTGAFSRCTALATVNYNARNSNSGTDSGDYYYDYISVGESPTGGVLSENGLFYQDSSLVTVNIGSNVVSIPPFSFRNISGITTLTIPNSIRRLGRYAFADCNSLTTLNFNADSITFADNAFMNDTNITTLNIGNNVTVIPSFSGLRGITSLTIPSSVRQIAQFAFSNCTGLTTLNFNADSLYFYYIWDDPENMSMNYMPNNVFMNDTNITTMNIGNNVTAIPQNAFYNLSGLTTLSIPSSVLNIGADAFNGCSSLSTLTIPASVRQIGQQAFGNCTRLTTLNFNADSLYYINIHWSDTSIFMDYMPNNVFMNDTNITTLNIGNNVTAIPDNAFNNLSGLTTLNMPTSVVYIGNESFRGCEGLTTLTIPSSVKQIGSAAFADCTGLTTLNFNADSLFTIDIDWTGLADTVFNYMPNDVFMNDTNITTLNIGNNVTAIPDNAFNNLSGLTTLNTPTSVVYIGNESFRGCEGLTTLTIPSSVKQIGSAAFADCTRLTTLTIPSSVKQIGPAAFADCTGLTTLNFNADSLFTIDIDWAGLADADTVFNHMPNDVFQNTNVTSLTIGNNVKLIPSGAFYGLSRLSSVVIPDSVVEVGQWAFYNCRGLSSVTIGKSVTDIGYSAFHNCDSLLYTYYQDSIVSWCGIHFSDWGSNPTSYSHNLYIGNNLLTYLTIPSTVTSIGQNQFRGCQSITTLTIPNSVTSIGSSAFYGCSGIDTLALGTGVSSIGSDAFGDCTGISCIVSQRNTAPSIEPNSFFGVDHDIPVHIPCGRTLSYMSRWNYFSDFIEATGATFSALTDNSSHGSVTILVQPTCTAPTAVVAAYANNGYSFDHWSDGNTQNPRSLSVSTDTVIVAYFISTPLVGDTVYVHDTTIVNNFIHDTIYVDNYIYDTTIVNNYIYDTAYVHDTTIVNNFIHDTTYVDNYIYDTVTMTIPIEYHTLSLTSEQPSFGFVVGSGTYSDSTVVEIAAIAMCGNHFVQWSDGGTENPRHVIVTEDINLTVSFATDEVGITDVEPSGASVTAQGNVITVQGAEEQRIRIFDAVGRLLSTEQSVAEIQRFRIMAAGVYLVQVGYGTAQRVVIGF